ncbi:MAG: hypothetical protein EOP04_05990 [Proteobacteria bacterium]|nr:MAG: hypothetical protein EOP04_05990 [Pseudomonadota bacterium]
MKLCENCAQSVIGLAILSATTMKTFKASLCLTGLLLIVLVWLDGIGTGGAIYRFMLTKMGVLESLALYSSLAIMGAYLLLEVGLTLREKMKAK